MDLPTYLKKHDLSQAQFAERLGCSQGLVSHWCLGRVDVTKEWAEKIEVTTAGEVTKEEAIFAMPAKNEPGVAGVAA